MKQHRQLLDAYQEELEYLDELRKYVPAFDRRMWTVNAKLGALVCAAKDQERYLAVAELVDAFIGQD